MLACPFCKTNIDDDSLYCDQCGQEILICPKCGRPGKGKMCTFDGTQLIPAKDKIDSSISISGIEPTAQAKAGISPTPSELHLINKNLNLDIKIDRDVIIGRASGDFVDIFKKYNFVSSKHLQISFDLQRGWVATDLGSTNGTKYNDTFITSNQPQILQDKSFLQIASIEFYIEIKKPVGKTGTLRI